jgi:hypothetical protein
MNTRSTSRRKAASWANEVKVLFEVPRIRASEPIAVDGRTLLLSEGAELSEIGGVLTSPEGPDNGNSSLARSQDGIMPACIPGW